MAFSATVMYVYMLDGLQDLQPHTHTHTHTHTGTLEIRHNKAKIPLISQLLPQLVLIA